MNLNWDLSDFYNGFSDPQYIQDKERLNSVQLNISEIIDNNKDTELTLEEIIRASEELTHLLTRLFNYVQLTLSTNSTHEIALKELDSLSQLQVSAMLTSSKMTRFIGKTNNLLDYIQNNKFLKEYEFFLLEEQHNNQHQLPENKEKVLLNMSLSGGDAFSKLRDRLMGDHTVEYEDKQMPLSYVRGLAYDSDANVRKNAYKAECASYAKVETPMAFCISSIKREANTLCKEKNFNSVLEEQLYFSRMDKETLNAMLDAIKDALPIFQTYLKAKAKHLGHKNGLPFYDLFAPISSDSLRYTPQEARDLLISTFTSVDKQMGDFIKEAYDGNWIDLCPKEGKQGGAFCCGNYQLKQSRILSNFMGSFSDVSTLAHELGHAWHDRCLTNVPVLLTNIPMSLAETASIFNETLLNKAVRENADEQTKLSLLENSLMEATQTVVDIYSRFLFESKVVEESKKMIPTPEMLNKWMIEAQIMAYGDGLDKDYLNSGMWVNKGHYYDTNLHFYNFPYAFGHLFSLGIFNKYQQLGAEFMPVYHKLLAGCGSASVAGVAEQVGINVRSKSYWESALNVIKEEVNAFVALLNKKV